MNSSINTRLTSPGSWAVCVFVIFLAIVERHIELRIAPAMEWVKNLSFPAWHTAICHCVRLTFRKSVYLRFRRIHQNWDRHLKPWANGKVVEAWLGSKVWFSSVHCYFSEEILGKDLSWTRWYFGTTLLLRQTGRSFWRSWIYWGSDIWNVWGQSKHSRECGNHSCIFSLSWTG